MTPDSGSPLPPTIATRIHAARDDAGALELLRAAVAVPSVTGSEAAYARQIAGVLSKTPAEVRLDEFADDRANLWARWGSSDSGRSGLLFAGHLDTVHVTGWREHWAGTEREDPFAGALVDGAVWGRGVGDLKAGISAVVAALQLLHRAGLAPDAPVTALFVADEESGEPNTGTSAGMRRALDQVESGDLQLAGDLAVYVEPTTMQIYPAHMGFFTTEIIVTGKSSYFGTPELGVDALRAGAAVLQALWEYDAQLRTRSAAPLIGHPFLLVTGVESGGYIAVPGECRIALIRKLTPEEDLNDARAELDRVITDSVDDPRLHIATAYPAGRDHPVGGTALVTDSDLAPVQALRSCIALHYSKGGRIEGAPYWSEGPFLSGRLGIPTVYCAPGDIRNCHTFDEHVAVDEYLAAVVVFATFIATHCGTRDLP